MRSTLIILVVAVAGACASAGGSGNGAATIVERRNTGVTVSSADGQSSMTINSEAALETRSYPVPATAQALWQAMPGAYEALGIPLAALDSSTMTIGNPGLAVRGGRVGTRRVSHYLNCGMDPMTGPLADRADVRLSAVARVRAGSPDAVLEVQVSGTAVQRGISTTPVYCTSTGALEEALATAAKVRLAGG